MHHVLRHRAGRVTHTERVPARPGIPEPWPDWIGGPTREVFAAEGVETPWAHQAEAWRHLAAGRHVVLATGTASGKSLVFQAPAVEALRRGRDGTGLRGHRRPSVLYLAPTKALAGDQLRRMRPSAGLIRAARVDGDSSREDRQWAREHADYLLTNPDTLHHSILPSHHRWSRFLAGLRYLVIDECHHYRGIFGAHVAHVVRRLRRVCAAYGSEPQVVLSSATVAEPDVFAGRLTGLDVVAVTDDASPRPAREVVLWEPPLWGEAEDTGPTSRRSAASEAAELLADLVVQGVRSLVFVRSRRGAETVAGTTQRLLAEVDPDLPGRVATYRGGYLPEERRELESRLRQGDLLGLATTNALELGIDIAGLDAVVSVGFPGTQAALHQQWGRAGRTGADRSALGVLIARDDPLDTYLVHHPGAVLGAPLEAGVFDPDNPYVLGPHLAAAAQELPLTDDDAALFGPRTAEGIDALADAGWLRRRPAGWFWTRRERASDLADLRSSGGRPVQIVDAATGRLVGTVDAGAADATVHGGAVYLHQGRTFVVDDYHCDDGVAVVHAEEPDWTTSARSTTDIAVVTTDRECSWGSAAVRLGSVEVTRQVTSYVRRGLDGRPLGEEPLDLPARTLATQAVWWTVAPDAVAGTLTSADVPGAAHAAEHAAIGLLPLLATCDRWDIGGVSTAMHPDTQTVTIFVHDGHPGGAGFAERGYAVARQWLSVTREAIVSCECADGCPSCVQSPKCGNGNHPLDKTGAVVLLDLLLADAVDPGPVPPAGPALSAPPPSAPPLSGPSPPRTLPGSLPEPRGREPAPPSAAPTSAGYGRRSGR